MLQNKNILYLLLLLLLPLLGFSQQKIEKPEKRGFLFFRINRFDKNGERHGRWKVYFGETEVMIRNGRFRHGVEVGKWKYYYPDGTRYMVEKYSRRDNNIQVTKYHENGSLARKGTARILRSTFKDHYYWFGDWQVYDTLGNYSHTETYKSGNLVGTTKK
ncbi:toxin-antitoxin system YwqK family antitoxin [Pontibacter mangrovi]|uniref:Toxin-antitoxin system YwqK family antitoxin n=1 Tax=Pontibacter mangrovi TaxID=2589816 RepID=A0A501W984_9BACT|nr:hypothetical protein [Pontibacter mangrovi]TPE45918.1 hypothetical protein FJM65_00815 [Pontibacter mangrovi]